MSNVHLRGTALDSVDQKPIRGLQLQVGTLSRGRFAEIAIVTCRNDGTFQVPVDFDAYPAATNFEIRAIAGGRRATIEQGTQRFSVDTAPTRVQLAVVRSAADKDVSPPDQPDTLLSVRGRMTHADGSPVVGAFVQAFHRTVTGWIPLTYDPGTGSVSATATSDASGGYAIPYDPPATYAPPLTTPLRLVLRATYTVGSLTKTLESAPVYEPEDHSVIDLVSQDTNAAGTDRYGELDAEVPNHLDGAAYAALTQEGVALLAPSVGRDQATVQRFVDAKNLDVEAGAPAVPTEALFALLQQGMPAEMDAICTTSAARLEELMAAAADANDAPATVATNAATYAADLRINAEYRGLADLGPYPYGSSLALTLGDPGVDDTKHRRFLRMRLDHAGPMEDFWVDVAADGTIGADATALRRMHDVGQYSLWNPQVLEIVDQVNAADTTKDIAGYSSTDWDTLLTTNLTSTGVPPVIPDEIPGTGATQRANYVALLIDAAEGAYPSAFARRRVIDRLAGLGSPEQVDLDVKQLLEADVDHEFTARVTDAMVSSLPTQPRQDDAKERLQKLRRLYQISPAKGREDAMDGLDGEGLHSAWHVHRAGRRALGALAPSLGQDVVDEIAAKAARTYAFHANLFTSLAGGQNNPNSVPKDTPQDYTDDPVFAEIFDGVGFCACKHCRSLLSPAAYLVDLLDWLHTKDDGAVTYLERLDARRSDIRHLKLSCENTNTPLPYVDLVLEILENAIAPRPAGFEAIDTSDLSAEELAANPTWVNLPAYDAVKGAVFPRAAPFNLYNAQASGFLEHIGVSRVQLMEAYQTDISATVTPTDAELAAARLGLSAVGLDALVGGPADEDLWNFGSSGFSSALDNDVADLRARASLSRLEMLDIMACEFWNPGGLFSLLPAITCDPDETTVDGGPADADYGRLMRFLRAQSALGWDWLELDKLITTLGWTDLDASAVEQLSAVGRLMEHTDLDVVSLLSWWGDLDVRVDRPGAEDPTPTLYDRLLLANDAVLSLRDPAGPPLPEPFLLADPPDELLVPGGPMTDHLAALQAAFGVDETDLLDAMADVGFALTLTLSELSAVYRRVSLAQALGLTVRQALSLRDLQWRNPVHVDGYLGNLDLDGINTLTATAVDGDCVLVVTTGGTPSAGGSSTLAVGDIAEFVAGSWLLRIVNVGGFPPAGTRLLVSEATTLVAPLSDGTDTGKVAVFDGSSVTPSLETPNANDLIKIVGRGTLNEDVVFEYLGGTWSVSASLMDPFAGPAGALAFVEFVRRIDAVKLTIDDVIYISNTADPVASNLGPTDPWMQSVLGDLRDLLIPMLDVPLVEDPDGALLRALMLDRLAMSQGDWDAVHAHLSLAAALIDSGELDLLNPYLDPELRAAIYAAEPPAQTPAVRHAAVLQAVTTGLAKIEARKTIVQRIALASGLEERSLEDMRGRSFDAVAAADWTDTYLVSAFTAGAVGDWSDITRVSQPEGFATLELMGKIGRIVAAFSVTHDELMVWFDDSPGDDLEVIKLEWLMVPDRFVSPEEWEQTIALFQFRDRLPGDYPEFHQIWRNNIGLFDPSDFFDPLEQRTGWSAAEMTQLMMDTGSPLLRGKILNLLAECAEIAAAIGAAPLTVQQWRVMDMDASMAADLVGAVRGKYRDTAAWYAVARPIRNQLRERQRAALVDYLVATEADVAKPADLQAKYLIDVEMDPCMMTSRVKLALSSVQQFIQRGFLNLETGVAFIEVDHSDWAWRKSYRVWEAGRKVFLYPENWIEPELRDDKSSLFEDFENALLGNAVTSETAEEAVGAYIQGLLDLSTMEITAVSASEVEPGGAHFLGRTHAPPHQYFHRYRTPAGAYRPWRRVGLELTGDQHAMREIGGRLFIAWLTVVDGDETQDITATWAEQRPDGAWNPPRTRTYPELIKDVYLDKKWSLTLNKLTDDTLEIRFRHPKQYDVITLSLTTGDVVREPTYDVTTDLNYAIPSNFLYYYSRFQNTSVPLLSLRPYSPGALASVNLLDAGADLADITVDHRRNLDFHDGPAVIRFGGVRTYVADRVPDMLFYQFRSFDHPYAASVYASMRVGGVFGVLDPAENSELYRQQTEDATAFETTYSPTNKVWPIYPVDDFAFGEGDAYGGYNWELFFHVPFMVADRLSTERRFEESHRWYSTIFDPTNTDVLTDLAIRPWKVKPLMEPPAAPVTSWGVFTGADSTLPASVAAKEAFVRQVDEWLADPFNPHLIARLRPGTYQRALVMKYLDNLIAWADDLFARDSIESLNEATTLYLLALHVLGDRPEELPARVAISPLSFDDFSGSLDWLSNPMLALEDFADAILLDGEPIDLNLVAGLPDLGPTYYFCVPRNDKLDGYWDTVADRLFKIRHCMNIDGLVRQLPLFQPPIDPGLLVRARAAGIDLSTVLDELQTPRPGHRFTLMSQRAQSLTGSVRGLGAAMLQALEKRDAEEVALLRSTLEISLTQMVTTVRRDQVKSARRQVDAAKLGIKEAEARRDHYQDLLTKGKIRQGELPGESKQRKRLTEAFLFDIAAKASSVLASALASTPQFHVAGAPVPGITVEQGGHQGASPATLAAAATQATADTLRYRASVLSINAGYERRKQDWRFQRSQALNQLKTLDKQLVIAEIGLAIAEQELENHRMQLANLRDVHQLMHSKFTNQQLYAWQVSELSKLYFQAYQLAHDMARKAQRCFRYEIGDSDTEFIVPGHFDSLKQGLLAGERLQLQLDLMEARYLDNNVREFEITKQISLARLDATALELLRLNGTCDFTVPRYLFDLDFAQHYFRRLKGVSITIAGVSGSHSGVNAELTLSKAWVDRDPTQAAAPDDDGGGSEKVVISGGADDTGLFSFSFDDPRYVPFERRGAIGDWTLAFPGLAKSFDLRSIADVTLTLRYTARQATSARSMGTIATEMGTAPTAIGWSAASDFPDAWHAFKTASSAPTLSLPLGPDLLPYGHAALSPEGATITVIAIPTSAGFTGTTEFDLTEWQTTTLALATGTGDFEGVRLGSLSAGSYGAPAPLDLELTDGDIEEIADVIVIVEYALS